MVTSYFISGLPGSQCKMMTELFASRLLITVVYIFPQWQASQSHGLSVTVDAMASFLNLVCFCFTWSP